MTQHNSNVRTNRETIGLSAGVTPLPTNDVANYCTFATRLLNRGGFQVREHNDAQSNKRIGLWIGVAMLVLALGVGMMESTAFAAAMGSPLQGRSQPNQQDTGTAQGQAPAVPNSQRAPHAPLVNDAYLYMLPEAGAPVNGGTAIVGRRFVLDLMLNAGSNTDVNVQQSYLTFTQAILQNARVSSIATSCVPTNTVTGDLTTFDAVLQNEACNGPGNCTFRGVPVGPGTLAFASGALG